VSKRTLGRGLGDLLGSNRGTEPAAAEKPSINPGLRILIAGASQTPEKSASAPITPPEATPRESKSSPNETHLHPLTRVLAVGGLASGDLALLGWTAHYAFTHQHILGFWGAAGCTGSVLVAALCGTAAASLAITPSQR
jgi:hypothetical protein